MNKVILMGRLTREPEVRYSQGAEPVAVARYTLAVNRRFKRKDEPEAGLHSLRCLRQARRICGEIFPEGAAGGRDWAFAGAQLGQGRRAAIRNGGYH